MNLIVTPGTPLKGAVPSRGSESLPGDKSISHRAAIFGALAEGRSILENYQFSGVTRVLINALKECGVEFEEQSDKLIIEGVGLRGLLSPKKTLDCGNSATTLRLLCGLLSGLGIEARLTGSMGLQKRPMGRILKPLGQMGALIHSSDGKAPLELSQRPSQKPLSGLSYVLPVASAQVKTCLMLAALYADNESRIIENAPTRDHTENLLNHMGAFIQSKHEEQTSTITIQPPQKPLKPLRLTIPGDISSVAFLIVAALITPRSEILIKNVGLNPTRTGLLDALIKMGADIKTEITHQEANEPVGNIYVRSSKLKAVQIEGDLVVRMIDEFPAFTIAALTAEGKTIVKDAQELRYKETDRITVLGKELEKLGVHMHEKEDGFELEGKQKVRNGVVCASGDHRIAMALTLSGLIANAPVVVKDAGIIKESFPNFTAILRKLGANLNEVH